LPADILEKFRENAYTGTQAFWYIDVQELKDLSFKPGEIVDLKEALKFTWKNVSLVTSKAQGHGVKHT
jgi:hypothetical protein